jgi:4-aminobutyrate aminotransferase
MVMYRRGMFLLSTSIFETMRFIPPLTVSEAEVTMALEIFEAALADVFKK